jgi:hypothetical protein
MELFVLDLPQNFDKTPSAYHCVFNDISSRKTILANIKIPPKPDNKTYDTLPGSDPKDQAKIIELFSIMGSHGKVDLLMNYKKHLEKLGKEIEHVHPIKLLGVIFSNPNMKQYMDNIFSDYFKWKYFIDGFTTSMKHEISKNNLYQYVNDFVQDVKADPKMIDIFFKKKDWKGLINYLIHS